MEVLELTILNGLLVALGLVGYFVKLRKDMATAVLVGLVVVADVVSIIAYANGKDVNMVFGLIGAVVGIYLYSKTKHVLSFVALLKIFAPYIAFASLSLLLVSVVPPEAIAGIPSKAVKKEAPSPQQAPPQAKSPIERSEEY